MLLSLAATKWLVSTWKDLPSARASTRRQSCSGFACALVFSAALLAGLLPAISSTGKSGQWRLCRLRHGSTAGSRSRTALRKTLLTVEIATTVVLLIAAGLLLKSFLASAGDRCGLRNRQCADDEL